MYASSSHSRRRGAVALSQVLRHHGSAAAVRRRHHPAGNPRCRPLLSPASRQLLPLPLLAIILTHASGSYHRSWCLRASTPNQQGARATISTDNKPKEKHKTIAASAPNEAERQCHEVCSPSRSSPLVVHSHPVKKKHR
jgi:hypothetical protein